MVHRLKTAEGKTLYALRKRVPGPVFGIIKSVLGLRQFHLRGLESVRSEWNLGEHGVEPEADVRPQRHLRWRAEPDCRRWRKLRRDCVPDHDLRKISVMTEDGSSGPSGDIPLTALGW